MPVNVDDRDLVEDIRVILIDFPEAFFVRSINDQDDIEFIFRENKRKVSRVDGAVLRSEMDTEFLIESLGPDIENWIMFGVKRKNEITCAGDCR